MSSTSVSPEGRCAYVAFRDDNNIAKTIRLLRKIQTRNPTTRAELIVVGAVHPPLDSARIRSLWPTARFVTRAALENRAPHELRLGKYDRLVILEDDLVADPLRETSADPDTNVRQADLAALARVTGGVSIDQLRAADTAGLGAVWAHKVRREQTKDIDAPSDLAHAAEVVERARREGLAGPLIENFERLLESLPPEFVVELAQRKPGAEELLQLAAGFSASGLYDLAVSLRQAVVRETGRISNPLAFARDMRAVSRYDDARLLGIVATLQQPDRASAHAWLAETNWITGDLPAAEKHTRAALEINAAQPLARRVEARIRNAHSELAHITSENTRGATLTHVAFYMDACGNFGDRILPDAIRRSVERLTHVAQWRSTHAHQVFDDTQLERANASDAVVVGGGGLILPDTMPNGNSGWQWNVPAESLRNLRVPLAITAVGYNLFDGQDIHGPRLAASMTLVADRAILVGLRNRGSVERVRDLVPRSLRHKITYMPCPTTFIDLMKNGGRVQPADHAAKTATVHLNVAFDRPGLRYKGRYGEVLLQISRFVKAARSFADVRIAAHTPQDERIAQDLYSEFNDRIPVDSLYSLGTQQALDIYRRTQVVIGTRGHAGMIPLGVGTPIVSLVSHPKLGYFLDDISHPDWGVAVSAPDLAEQLVELTQDIVDHQVAYRAAIGHARAVLKHHYDIALQNLINAL